MPHAASDLHALVRRRDIVGQQLADIRELNPGSLKSPLN